jgi:hypothetical protein
MAHGSGEKLNLCMPDAYKCKIAESYRGIRHVLTLLLKRSVFADKLITFDDFPRDSNASFYRRNVFQFFLHLAERCREVAMKPVHPPRGSAAAANGEDGSSKKKKKKKKKKKRKRGGEDEDDEAEEEEEERRRRTRRRKPYLEKEKRTCSAAAHPPPLLLPWSPRKGEKTTSSAPWATRSPPTPRTTWRCARTSRACPTWAPSKSPSGCSWRAA